MGSCLLSAAPPALAAASPSCTREPPGTFPLAPCLSTGPCQKEPKGSAGVPVCRTPSSRLAPSSSRRAPGFVRPGSAGGEMGLPPKAQSDTHGQRCLPVAVRCCCCRRLGISVGGVAPLQRRRDCRQGGGQHPPGEARGAGAAGHPLGTATEQRWDPAGSRCPCHQAHTSLITIPQGLSQTLTLKN